MLQNIENIGIGTHIFFSYSGLIPTSSSGLFGVAAQCNFPQN